MDLPHGGHSCRQCVDRTTELFECKAQHLSDNIVERRFQAHRSILGNTFLKFFEGETHGQLIRQFSNMEAGRTSRSSALPIRCAYHTGVHRTLARRHNRHTLRLCIRRSSVCVIASAPLTHPRTHKSSNVPRYVRMEIRRVVSVHALVARTVTDISNIGLCTVCIVSSAVWYRCVQAGRASW